MASDMAYCAFGYDEGVYRCANKVTGYELPEEDLLP